MADIARTPRVPSTKSEYEAFLYATIGAEANGNSLSVLSAMARMNLDPWREAASLAELSAKAAVTRLTALIAALPGRSSAPDEAGLTATRLVKLLPQQGLLSPVLPQPGGLKLPPYLLAVVRVSQSKGIIYVILLLLVFVIGAQWFAARKLPPSAQPSVSETATRPNVPSSH